MKLGLKIFLLLVLFCGFATAQITKYDSISKWAHKDHKHLLVEGKVVFIEEKVPLNYQKLKVRDSFTKKQNVVYIDRNSGRFYFDSTVWNFYDNGKRFSRERYRHYGIVNNEGKVEILSKKATVVASGGVQSE